MRGDWGPFLLLVGVSLLARGRMPAWLFMWTIALAVFWGAKWLTWRRASRGRMPAAAVSVEYLFGWVGMDADVFLSGARPRRTPAPREWAAATLKTLAGAVLLVAAGRLSRDHASLAVGWLGMLGLILLLHFGLFHLLALEWRRRRVDVQPLMNGPLGAASLVDFWGRRWNAAFNELARDIVFLPLARRCGAKVAALGVFLASGLVHDLVISVPAGGGYGLPTAYFLLQGIATLFERSAVGRSVGLGRGWRGHVFTLVVTAGPVFWLFHPPFARNVILPMLRFLSSALGF
ncbi:MAG TPA: MBOAT family protein [Terriglobia bacterium]|nr:MBOAT family protein [Terriglobia bacterium]